MGSQKAIGGELDGGEGLGGVGSFFRNLRDNVRGMQGFSISKVIKIMEWLSD